MPTSPRINLPIRRRRPGCAKAASSHPRRSRNMSAAPRVSASNTKPSFAPSPLKKTSSEPSLDWVEETISRGRRRNAAGRESSAFKSASVVPDYECDVAAFMEDSVEQNHVEEAAVLEPLFVQQSENETINEALKTAQIDSYIERAFHSSTSSQSDLSQIPKLSVSANITDILAAQETALQARKQNIRGRSVSSQLCAHLSGGLHLAHSPTSTERLPLTSEQAEQNWLNYLRIELKRNPDFFTSTEARLEETDRISRGGTGYLSLKLTHNNSADLREMFVLHFETKVNAGHPTAVYEQFKTVIGQYSRFCCVVKLADYRKLFEVGAIYSLVSHMDAVRCFLQYFQLRSSPATVMTKCIHLKSLCDNADRFYSAESSESSRALLRAIRNVSEYLKSVRSVQKKETRRMARQRKTSDSRAARAVLFTEGDYNHCLSKARERMQGIMSTYDRIFVRKGKAGGDAAVSDLGLVSKWCVNFLSALMLWGGGQRPQVYTQLLCPSASELDDMQQRAGESDEGFIELRPQHEKTTRALDMPNVYFPAGAAPFIRFHVEVIRRIVLEQVMGSDDESSVDDSLLLDTRNGRSLRTPQVKRTFSAFLSNIDPELCSVTPMSLRGSYATIMFSKYTRQEIFKGWTEDEFLRALAKSMNTSVEQLRTTYAGIEEADFDVVARQLTSAFEQNSHSNDCCDDENE